MRIYTVKITFAAFSPSGHNLVLGSLFVGSLTARQAEGHG
jgi:hypothetical protein